MDRTATGAVALQTERRCLRSTRETAGREREGSAARSVQQMSARRAGRCRETITPARYAQEQDARILRREKGHWKIWSCTTPNSSFSQERRRADFCSTAPARAPAFALPVWNGTGTRFAPNRFSLRAQRTRNDSRSRTRNRSQSQPPCSARVHSYSVSRFGARGRVRTLKAVTCHRTPNTSHGATTQTFSSESRIAEIAADGVLSGGTTSGIGPAEFCETWGCSIRVAMSIAVKSNAPARK